MPNPCHFQNYDQSMSQLSSGSEGCSPKMCADEVNDGVAGCGRYTFGKRLGEGQYGTVWEATDIKTGLTYAAKVAEG